MSPQVASARRTSTLISVPLRAVHDVSQRIAGAHLEPVGRELTGERLDRSDARDLRCHPYLVHAAKRMIGGERLLAEDVQDGASGASLEDALVERSFVHGAAARDVHEDGALAHQVESLGIPEG